MKVKKKSQLQEKSVAKDLNASVVVASGALWGSKGDVRHDNLLVECKTTEKPYYSVTFKVWDKIEKEAVKDGLRLPVMCVDIKDGRERYAVFLDKHFRHYKSFNEIYDGNVYQMTDRKSFRVDSPKRVLIFATPNKKLGNESFTFIITPWDDFVYMLKGGE